MKEAYPNIIDYLRTRLGDAAVDPEERATRLLEEALELARSLLVESSVVMKLVDRVYNRPHGDPVREMAQTQITLTALAMSLHARLDVLEQQEWERLQVLDPQALRDSAQIKIDGGMAHRRGMGRSGLQITQAPAGATYVVPRAHSYWRHLAVDRGRSDLKIITVNDLESIQASGAPIVLDHATRLNQRQWDIYQIIRGRHGA